MTGLSKEICSKFLIMGSFALSGCGGGGGGSEAGDSDYQIKTAHYSIYPDPSSDKIYISLHSTKALQIADNTKTVKVIKGEGSCDILMLDKEDIDLAIDGGEKFLEVNLDKRQYCSQTIMLQTQDGKKQVIEQLNYMDGMQFELNQVFIKLDDGNTLNPTTDSMQKGKSYKITYLLPDEYTQKGLSYPILLDAEFANEEAVSVDNRRCHLGKGCTSCETTFRIKQNAEINQLKFTYWISSQDDDFGGVGLRHYSFPVI